MKKRFLSLFAVTIFVLSFLCSSSARNAQVYAADYDKRHQVAALTNHERADKGVSLLAYSDELSRAANERAKEIMTSFSHTRPDGRDCYTIMDDLGIRYSYFGENIAYGPSQPASVMSMWMESTPHRKNILKSEYKYIGVGMATGSDGIYYWVQLFASSGSLSGTVVTMEGETYNTTSSKAATTTKATTAATTASRTTSTVATTATTEKNQANVTTTQNPNHKTGQINPTTSVQHDSDSDEKPVKKGFFTRIIEFFKRLFGIGQ